MKWIKKLFCYIGLHQWQIHAISNGKGRLINHERECQSCDKYQDLQRPKEYHPIKLIWTDVVEFPSNGRG